jgi:hypothetical protein
MGELAFLSPFAYLTIFGFRLRASLTNTACREPLHVRALLAYTVVGIQRAYIQIVHTNC